MPNSWRKTWLRIVASLRNFVPTEHLALQVDILDPVTSGKGKLRLARIHQT